MNGQAHRERDGQLAGTVIPHASAIGGLVIAMIGATFLALAMPLLRHRRACLARALAAAVGAVDLPAVALSAHRELRPASRTISKSLVRHALAHADVLPWSLFRARVTESLRPRTTQKARSSNSWPSSFSARAPTS